MTLLPKIYVQHWRYEDMLDSDCEPGWRCFIFSRDGGGSIEEWMKRTMTGEYECDLKFNSGHPAYITWIKEECDAMMFILTFGETGNGNPY